MDVRFIKKVILIEEYVEETSSVQCGKETETPGNNNNKLGGGIRGRREC